MKCYHKKYFPSQFTHKSVRQRQRHAKRVCGRGRGRRDGRWHRLQGAKQGFKLLLYVAEKVTNRVAIKFHMLITCVLATHTFPTPISKLWQQMVPRRKKLSKVLLFFLSFLFFSFLFFSLHSSRGFALFLSACYADNSSDSKQTHNSSELTILCRKKVPFYWVPLSSFQMN